MLRRYWITQAVLSVLGFGIMVVELSQLPGKVIATREQVFSGILANPLLAPAIFRTLLPRS